MEDKETFVEPVVEVVILEGDVIRTSACTCPNELPEMPG